MSAPRLRRHTQPKPARCAIFDAFNAGKRALSEGGGGVCSQPSVCLSLTHASTIEATGAHISNDYHRLRKRRIKSNEEVDHQTATYVKYPNRKREHRHYICNGERIFTGRTTFSGLSWRSAATQFMPLAHFPKSSPSMPSHGRLHPSCNRVNHCPSPGLCRGKRGMEGSRTVAETLLPLGVRDTILFDPRSRACCVLAASQPHRTRRRSWNHIK